MSIWRKEETFRILAVATMMACIASAVAEAVRRVATGFDPALLVGLAFLVCLEGIATDRLARQLPDASQRLRLRLVEWVVILLLLRLALPLAQGPAMLAASVARWIAVPQSLIDGGLLAGAILLFGVWILALKMSQALEALGPEADAPPPKDSAAYYAWLTRPRADTHGEGWAGLIQLFLTGGVVLLLGGALARVDVGAALSLRHPAIAGIVGNALLYFGLGFALLAQGNYAMLRANWERNTVGVSRRLAARWTALGAGFVLLMAFVALLLPVRPSLTLFGAVFDALAMALYYAASAVLTVFAAVAYLLGWLASLLGMESGGEDAPLSMRLTPPQAQPPRQPVAWWEAIQGLVLWAIILGVVTYALVRFVRERRGLLAQLSARGPLRWICGLLTSVWRWLSRSGGRMGAHLRSLISRPAKGAGVAPRRRRPLWPRPRGPREQVRLLYLVAVEQAARRGLTRAAQDTPYEYARRLEPYMSEAGDDLEVLTQAFVEARYSPREFSATEVGPLRAALRRLRHWLCRVGGRAGE